MGGNRPSRFGQVPQSAQWHHGGASATRRMETRMSKSVQIVLVMAITAVMAACAPKAPEPAPEITVEPTQTGKYK
jgi:hypothetical protein